MPKDAAAARAWLERAAEAPQGNVDATRRLGTMLLKGEGGPASPGEGYALWEDAAELGDEKARENIKEHRRVMNNANFL